MPQTHLRKSWIKNIFQGKYIFTLKTVKNITQLIIHFSDIQIDDEVSDNLVDRQSYDNEIIAGDFHSRDTNYKSD